MMKYYFTKIACISLLFFSCEKIPKGIISPDKMTEVIYDISMLNQIKSNQPEVVKKDSLDFQGFVFQKYDIDSLSFQKSIHYYTLHDLKKLKGIYKRVLNKIEAEQKKIEEKNRDTIQE